MASDDAKTNNLPEYPSENWYAYYRFKLGRDSPSEARNILLVVATLIAAVTFQAGVNPPGGVWQESKEGNPGESILGSHKGAYTVFILTNTLAYASAVQTIFILIIGCPFQTEVWIAILSMSSTYGASIASVQPSGVMNPGFLFIAFFTPCILRLALQITRWFMRLALKIIRFMRSAV
uniref:Uncharacterized protein LOC107421764 n=1 Tax=Rhizophora mucronata TaxID=61149 RepID=A0A2P2MKM4_RHIMU